MCCCIAEDLTTVKVNKPKAEDDLNAQESSSEEEDELMQEGHELKDMLERDEGKESEDEDEDEEDPDWDEMKGTSALFLQGLVSIWASSPDVFSFIGYLISFVV